MIALGLLAGGCSSEPPPPPCQPVSDDAVDSLVQRESAASTSRAASLVEINRQREQAEEIARQAQTAWRIEENEELRRGLAQADDIATEAIRKIDELVASSAFSETGTSAAKLALDYAVLSAQCERGLASDYPTGISNGIEQVMQVLDKVNQMETQVRQAEQQDAEAARAVQAIRAIIGLSEAKMKEATE